MYVDEPPKDGNIPDFNISKIDICPFRTYQRSSRLFQGNFSKDIHQRSRLLCFTQNAHTGQTGFKICPFLKWALLWKWGYTLYCPRWKDILITIKESTDVFLNNLMPNLYNSFSVMLLGFFGGATANGLYEGGSKFPVIFYNLVLLHTQSFTISPQIYILILFKFRK